MALGRGAAWLALLMLGTAATRAQQGPPPGPPGGATATGVILGRVVDADTGTPISGVLVGTLGAVGRDPVPYGSPAPPGRPQAMVSDTQGRFVFRNLAKGTYTLAANIGGNGYSPSGFLVTGMGHQIGAYLNGGYGQRRPNGPLQPIELGDGERITNLVIRMWKGGAINGYVSDEAGEPLVDIVVAAVRRSTDGRLLTGPTTRTDDRGAYRLGTLTPGTYVVVVPQTQVLMPASSIESLLARPPDPASAARFSSVGLPPAPDGGVRLGSTLMTTPPQMAVTNSIPPRREADRFFAYQTTFHPSAGSAARATAIVVRSGGERSEVNVQLQPVRTVQVSGTLLDGSGPVANFGVHLLPAEGGDDSSVLEVATAATDASGVFLFPNVPTGNYTLQALRVASSPGYGAAPPPLQRTVSEAPGAWVTQALAVGEENVRNLTLTLRPGIRLAGRVEFHGAGDAPAADRLKQLPIVLTRSRPLARTMSSPPAAVVEPTGAFAIAGVAPGDYLFTVRDVPGWTLQSVTAGGRDVTDQVFAVRDDMSDVVIVFVESGSELSGTVSASSGADAEGSVFVFPTDRSRWADARVSTRSYRVTRVDRQGAYRVPALIPGEYFVVAARDDAGGDWPDSRFLTKLASLARPVRIDAGQRVTATLQIVSIR